MTPLSRALNSISLPTPSFTPHQPPALTINERMEGQARRIRGEKGIHADNAPSIVISSMASMQSDVDYQYLRNYQQRDHKPMTAKDRARHGMLRMMLRKQLEVTRPNWPKHPNMRATDRNLDVEIEVRRENKRLAKSQSLGALGSSPGASGGYSSPKKSYGSPGKGPTSPSVDPFANFDFEKIASKPTMSMSPDFLKTFNLAMGHPGSPETRDSPPKTAGITKRLKTRTMNETLMEMGNTMGSFGVESGQPRPIPAVDRSFFYGKTNRLPSPSARNLELLKQQEFESSLKVYSTRPKTTGVTFLGDSSHDGVKGTYKGSKRNTVRIKRGVRIARNSGV
jgi:hypothetical protein